MVGVSFLAKLFTHCESIPCRPRPSRLTPQGGLKASASSPNPPTVAHQVAVHETVRGRGEELPHSNMSSDCCMSSVADPQQLVLARACRLLCRVRSLLRRVYISCCCSWPNGFEFDRFKRLLVLSHLKGRCPSLQRCARAASAVPRSESPCHVSARACKSVRCSAVSARRKRARDSRYGV